MLVHAGRREISIPSFFLLSVPVVINVLDVIQIFQTVNKLVHKLNMFRIVSVVVVCGTISTSASTNS